MTIRPMTPDRREQAAQLGEHIFDECMGLDVSLVINALVGCLATIILSAAADPRSAVEEVCIALATGVSSEVTPPSGETLQ